MPRVSIPADYTLIVEGDAAFRVLNGEVVTFGATLESGKEYKVDPFRAIPLYALRDSEVEVESGKFSYVKGNTVPQSWEAAAERIGSLGARRVMVVGGVDSGKTSFVTFLANRLSQAGERVGIVDADLGQKSIGPPATIGLGVVASPLVSLGEAEFVDGFFVGSVTPSGLLHRHVVGVRLMVEVAETRMGVRRVVVDTTGWVSEQGGRELKLFKAMALEPDVVVVVSRGDECLHIVNTLGRLFEVVQVEAPKAVRLRGRIDRREYRKVMYRKFFEGAKEYEYDFSKGVLYSTVFTGSELPEDERRRIEELLGVRVVYAEKSGDHVAFFTERSVDEQAASLLKAIYGSRQVKLLTGFEFLHTLVGIRNREKYLKGVGIVTGVYPQRKALRVLSTAAPSGDETLMLGLVKVNPVSFEEEAILEG